MTDQVYNFGAGPAMLPIPVMQQIKEEFLDYQGMGASIIEISHRSREFDDVIDRCDQLLRELGNLPANYRILYMHGGAQMQFAAVPLNLLGLKPSHRAIYSETGNFSKLANKEAQRYGDIRIVCSSANSDYDRIPELTPQMLDPEASYAFITSNNTLYGTQYRHYPDTGSLPLVVDATSDIFSRPVDFSKLGVMFAGLQKNLGPSGLAVVLIRDDLIGHSLEKTPSLLDYAVYDQTHSMPNTINTFAIYVMMLTLEWIKQEGGLSAMAQHNEHKAKIIYNEIDASDFYHGTAHPDHRSLMNVTFKLPNADLESMFLKQALAERLYALKGHRLVGGIRASIYNAMPVAGCEKLAAFMREFVRTNG
jgi:phosphoserine aminotransferase